MSKAVSLDTTPDTYVLFLDMLEVEDLFLVEQVVNQATKHPNNPVIAPGNVEDWDSDRASNWAASLLFDPTDGLFKAWYYGIDIKSTTTPGGERHSAIGYAYSSDGAFWHKPKLGLYEYNGSKENNICFRPPNGRASHFCALIDPKDPDPARRYQVLTWMEVSGLEKEKDAAGNVFEGTVAKNCYVPHYSQDGIHWQQTSNGVEWPNGDTGHILIDEREAPERRFKAYGQHSVGAGSDIEHMKRADQLPIDPADGCEHEIHFIYVLPYHDYYIMLYDFNRYRPYYGHLGYYKQGDLGITRQERVKRRVALRRGDLPPEEPEDDYGIYTGDIRLAVCRNAMGKFQRIQPWTPVVPRGERNEWDSGFLVLGGGSMIVRDDQIFLYYTGINETSAAGFTGSVPGRICTGLATLRLDGWTHLQARDALTPGTVTTKPITVKDAAHARLTVNVSHVLPWRDWIEVEVLDAETGKLLPGYSRKDAVGVMTEGLRVPVEWKDHKTLEAVSASQVRLRFHFNGRARLYSFTFTSV